MVIMNGKVVGIVTHYFGLHLQYQVAPVGSCVYSWRVVGLQGWQEREAWNEAFPFYGTPRYQVVCPD